MDYNLTPLLQKITKSLAKYLDNILPDLFDNWWKDAVYDKVTFKQKELIELNNIDSLYSLDLASLLKVLDNNWFQISNKYNLTYESRHYVKEMQIIRNKWAHIDSNGIYTEDIYRDLDTIQRFANFLNADEQLINDIKDMKNSIIQYTTSSSTQKKKSEIGKEDTNDKGDIKFKPGQIVTLKSDPTKKGAVLNIVSGESEDRYNVFLDNRPQTFYESQIMLEEVSKKANMLSSDEFHAFLSALQIKCPSLSTLYSLNAAKVDFIPYQFRPVLRFIRSDRPRLLIADGVGVGKTIEAGLILKEMQSRRDINSILIVCPRPLVTERKWEIEMKRFDERFVHLNGRDLRYCLNEMDLDGEWPDQYKKAIIPYSLFDESLLYGTSYTSKKKNKKGLLDLDPPPKFDLVIVDEAHHIRNQDTFSHKAVRFLCDHAEAAIFLTATPIQLGNNDLFVLLNTLRPDLIIDKESFQHMSEPNPYINEAVNMVRAKPQDWQNKALESLNNAVNTPWGESILKQNPEFQKIMGKLVSNSTNDTERVKMITDLENLHTFSGIINRTRRRDIGDFTIRKPETITVDFTDEQQRLHDKILQIQAEIFSSLYNDKNIKFMMTTIRRQVASCLFGLAPFLEEILKRHIDELSWDEADDSEILNDLNFVAKIENQIKEILYMVKHLDTFDPKLNALKTIIKDKQFMSNNKIMLFSSFRHTLNYLYKNLHDSGYRMAMVHGGTPDEDRVELRNRFAMHKDDPKALDVLLFSEIGCEGLDYQFCDCIVNYDIPWNPMRIEQRIGRIDRKGQKSENIAIYNLITPGTVDADIYERCLLRIGVFNNAIGGSEEILGEISKEIKDIAENFNLSEIERQKKFQQIADNKIRLIQEQEDLEQKQLELFGINLPQDMIKKEIEEASSKWLTPDALRRLIEIYLQKRIEGTHEFILGEKSIKTLRLSQEARNKLLQDFRQLTRQTSSTYRDWENWLKGGSQHLQITFDPETASNNNKVTFITPLHPLVHQASESFGSTKKSIASLKAYTNELSEGIYSFAIYQWNFIGIKPDLVLKPIGLNEEITHKLNNIFEITETGEYEAEFDIIETADKLDAMHHKLWKKAKEDHQKYTQEIAEYRRESLNRSHQARLSLLKEQLSQANDEKIRRMRQAQIDAAEADYARRIQGLDISIERADIIAEPVVYGKIEIFRDSYGK